MVGMMLDRTETSALRLHCHVHINLEACLFNLCWCMYRWFHFIHHKYNKENSLSPFAGLAFHPLDGILQAIPYCWTLFYIPMHSLTFELLLFMTGIWTTNIHDCLHGR